MFNWLLEFYGKSKFLAKLQKMSAVEEVESLGECTWNGLQQEKKHYYLGDIVGRPASLASPSFSPCIFRPSHTAE